jgi:hypothetical protein
MLEGVSTIDGGGLTTVKLTLITCEELTAPKATSVIVPL